MGLLSQGYDLAMQYYRDIKLNQDYIRNMQAELTKTQESSTTNQVSNNTSINSNVSLIPSDVAGIKLIPVIFGLSVSLYTFSLDANLFPALSTTVTSTT